jgi:hypothetical protein
LFQGAGSGHGAGFLADAADVEQHLGVVGKAQLGETVDVDLPAQPLDDLGFVFAGRTGILRQEGGCGWFCRQPWLSLLEVSKFWQQGYKRTPLAIAAPILEEAGGWEKETWSGETRYPMAG